MSRRNQHSFNNKGSPLSTQNEKEFPGKQLELANDLYANLKPPPLLTPSLSLVYPRIPYDFRLTKK